MDFGKCDLAPKNLFTPGVGDQWGGLESVSSMQNQE